MIRGLYTSALGMTTQLNKMDVVSNNIANVDTTGYKKDFVVTRSFSEELMKRLDDKTDLRHDVKVGKVQSGVFVDDVYTDQRNGTLRNTNAPLDMAISGDGYFTVSVKDLSGQSSIKYTRDGSFSLAPDGTLMTKDGGIVQGENGAILLPNGVININEKGEVYLNNELVDTLKMVDFEDRHTLRKFKDNYYNKTTDSKEKPFTAIVLSGFTENSNVSSVKEMVDMIATNRTYEANQKMVTIHDSILARAVSEVGRK